MSGSLDVDNVFFVGETVELSVLEDCADGSFVPPVEVDGYDCAVPEPDDEVGKVF